MTFTKRQKRLLSKALGKDIKKRAKGDPLRYPLWVKDRIRWDDDGEGWREYGISDEMGGWSDEELREYFDEHRYVIYSDYDCTGRPFTQWVEWHRNPNGSVSYVHQVGLDY